MTQSKKKGGSKPKRPKDDYDVEELGTVKVRKDGWPSEVPILVEQDLCWNFTTADGRRDLMYWLEAVFDNTPEHTPKTPKFDKAFRTLCEVISERFKKKVTVMWLFLEFTKKNKLPSLAWQAACWNEMLHRLEYDVPKKARADPGFKQLGGK